MIVFLPIMASMLPIINTSLAIKEVVKGTITVAEYATVFASTLAVAGLLLALSVYWCKREEVLFRS
ncbi:hypothetical protein [Rugamonas aquatica]|uniref:Uncharacterized protein n=1 Tax=Rugamonas aquatica TaxID=2743357 RepID=A0A6A7N2G7_9BURK|nr:hypothetical protein [Rugamonas aquatica]MQA39151.1 hypothetical protein [Rugamonas aquatica]